MLEAGLYPSFAEIGALLARGIDFETIQDETICFELDILNNERISAAITCENDYTSDTTVLLNRTMQLLSQHDIRPSSKAKQAEKQFAATNFSEKAHVLKSSSRCTDEQLYLQPLPDSCGSLESLESLPPPQYPAPILEVVQRTSQPVPPPPVDLPKSVALSNQRKSSPSPKKSSSPNKSASPSTAKKPSTPKKFTQLKPPRQLLKQQQQNGPVMMPPARQHYELMGQPLNRLPPPQYNWQFSPGQIMMAQDYVRNQHFPTLNQYAGYRIVDPYAQQIQYQIQYHQKLLQQQQRFNSFAANMGNNKFDEEFRNLTGAQYPKYRFQSNWKHY